MFPHPFAGRVHLAVFAIAAFVALSTIGCDYFPPLPERGGPAAESATTSAATETAEAFATACPADYPCPARPREPAPLHTTIAGLPEGVTVDRDAAWLIRGDPDRALHAVPLRAAGGGLDLAVAMSDAEKSAVTWLFSRDAHLSFHTKSIRRHLINIGEYNAVEGVLIDGDQGRGLLLWDGVDVGRDLPVMMRAWLPLGGTDFATGDPPSSLTLTDWSGDGIPDALIPSDDGDAAMLFAATDRPGILRPVARIASPTQVVDVDGDGAFEIVQRDGDTWHVERWDGTAFAAGSPIAATSAAPIPVTNGSLPTLPADLYFLRAGAVWRWPRAGVAVERVVAQSVEMAVQGFAVASEGGQVVAQIFKLDRPDVFAEWRVVDPVGGQPTRDVAVEAGEWDTVDAFEVAPGASYVVYSTVGGTGGDCGTPVYVAMLDGSSVTRLLGDCDRQRSDQAGGECRCRGLRLSRNGGRLAYSDGSGDLWVVDLPDGEPRRLVEGDFETLREPRQWSPDGRYLVVEDGLGECSGSILWDVDTESTLELDSACMSHLAETAWSREPGTLILTTGGVSPTAWHVTDSGPSATFKQLRRLWPERLTGGNPVTASPVELPGGDIGFVVKNDDPTVFPGVGVFRMRQNGAGVQLIAGLPPGSPDDGELAGEYSGVFGDVHWSPGGGAFLFAGLDASSGPHIPTLVGLSDGSAVWDVSDVLRGADGDSFVWGTE